MLTGGGRAFGPRTKGPDGWNRKVNRKEERVGLRVGLSDKWRSGDLCVVDRLGMSQSKTRLLNERLESRGWGDALFILAKERTEEMALEKEMFEFASRNLEGLSIIDDAAELGIWEIVKRKKVIIELGAVDELIHRLDPEAMWDQGEVEEWEDDEEIGAEEMASELKEVLAASQPSL